MKMIYQNQRLIAELNKKKPSDPDDDDITKITDRLRTHLIH